MSAIEEARRARVKKGIRERLYRVRWHKMDKAKRAILAVKHPDDISIESLRNLRTALHFGMMDVKNNSIMIAGPSPTVGKSFISVNLAAVLASNDKKVLLIDGDLRRGEQLLDRLCQQVSG